MKLAARAGRIVPSPTLRLMAVAKALIAQGVDVVDFASGEPDFDTPDPVKAEAEAAIRSGFTKYTASSGIDELKRAISDKLEAEQGLRYDPSQVLVSCGAKHTLYNLAEALLEAGDEVIIPTPFWVSYRDQVLLNDATPVLLETREAEGYAIDRVKLESCVTPRTKAIIVNSPCNPTGAIYDRVALEAIAEVALRHDLIVVSDEIYEKILYDGARHLSIAALGPEVAARTVVVNGVSKAYAMTGWRIGYGAGPKELITAMAKETPSSRRRLGRPNVDMGRGTERQDGCSGKGLRLLRPPTASPRTGPGDWIGKTWRRAYERGCEIQLRAHSQPRQRGCRTRVFHGHRHHRHRGGPRRLFPEGGQSRGRAG